jgi:hypothetical protein
MALSGVGSVHCGSKSWNKFGDTWRYVSKFYDGTWLSSCKAFKCQQGRDCPTYVHTPMLSRISKEDCNFDIYFL